MIAGILANSGSRLAKIRVPKNIVEPSDHSQKDQESEFPVICFFVPFDTSFERFSISTYPPLPAIVLRLDQLISHSICHQLIA